MKTTLLAQAAVCPSHAVPFRKSGHAFLPRVLSLAVLALLAPAVAHGAASSEVNLRDWLISKGVTVSDCVSGEGQHSTYGPANLFDGVKEVSTKAEAQANRWLAREYPQNPARATIAEPDELFASSSNGLSLVRFRLYRYSSLSDDFAVKRAPATWTLWGSPDGLTWEAVHTQSATNEWSSSIAYVDVEIPQDKRAPYRQFKFEAYMSYGETNPNYGITWYIGAMELELFVEESSQLSLRDVLVGAGITVADCVTGANYNTSGTFGPNLLFDGVKGTSTTTGTRWVAGKSNLNGVHVTIEIPKAARGEGVSGFALKGYRLWRNINSDSGRQRAPLTWTIQGSDDGETWSDIHSQSEAVAWGSGDLQKSVYAGVPSNETAYKYLRFVPQTANKYPYEWKVGLQEIEYFVEPVKKFTYTLLIFY